MRTGRCSRGQIVRDRQPLTIAVSQPRVVTDNVGVNVHTHAEIVRSASARVVVFPEQSLTGYELPATALTEDDPRLQTIAQACAEAGSIALVGAPVQDGANLHNSMLVIDGFGVACAYHKMNLTAGETGLYSPGRKPVVLVVDGWRLGVAVGKDVEVSEHARHLAGSVIDVYVAGIVKDAREASLVYENACQVALDHRIWVAFASFAGATGGGFESTAGQSGIWSPDAWAVVEAGSGPGTTVRAVLGP
jgi:predicted amidohydrolase